MKKNTNTNKGFTLIELMIVVAIIAIISAIAIPSLMKMRMQSNETAASASLKAVHTAQVSYRRDFPVYSQDLRDLFGIGMNNYTAHCGDVTIHAASISILAVPVGGDSVQGITTQANATAKAGYFYFSNHNYVGEEFMTSATPGTYNSGGRKTYFSNANGTTYEMDPNGVATAVDATMVAGMYNGVGDWNTAGTGGTGGAWSAAQ